MASHAYITTPLLRPAFSDRWGLLPTGSERRPGPVTVALAVMLAADPDRQRLAELRRAIADRIEADLALLDALDGDPDLEPSLGAPEFLTWQDGIRWARGDADERENAECVDCDGESVHIVPMQIGRAA